MTKNRFTYGLVSALRAINVELIVWPLGILILAVSDPHISHWSICPLKNLGFEFCPGCGLGKSISLLFRGQFLESFEAHPLGIPALLLLGYRTFNLGRAKVKTLLTT